MSFSSKRSSRDQMVPAQAVNHQESLSSRRELTSWWKQFKRGNAKAQQAKPKHGQAQPEQGREKARADGVFGVPLQSSIKYANVAISLLDSTGKGYIYGYVPIVVAKCGVYLKENATEVEGIFRLSGSEKRVKELLAAFDTPDRYGKGLDWTGYTVHDASSILRRFINQLPEPVIPLDSYERFRAPLTGHQAEAVGKYELQHPSTGQFQVSAAIRRYKHAIADLPPLNRQLLLYILDLLAVFASKSALNKMNTPNLAAVFQPGLLQHPDHAKSTVDYRLNQDVLIFLIEKQDHFLMELHGDSAAKAEAPASGVKRTASVTAAVTANAGTAMLQRSNTVPSKKSTGRKTHERAATSAGDGMPGVVDETDVEREAADLTTAIGTAPGPEATVPERGVDDERTATATSPLVRGAHRESEGMKRKESIVSEGVPAAAPAAAAAAAPTPAPAPTPTPAPAASTNVAHSSPIRAIATLFSRLPSPTAISTAAAATTAATTTAAATVATTTAAATVAPDSSSGQARRLNKLQKRRQRDSPTQRQRDSPTQSGHSSAQSLPLKAIDSADAAAAAPNTAAAAPNTTAATTATATAAAATTTTTADASAVPIASAPTKQPSPPASVTTQPRTSHEDVLGAMTSEEGKEEGKGEGAEQAEQRRRRRRWRFSTSFAPRPADSGTTGTGTAEAQQQRRQDDEGDSGGAGTGTGTGTGIGTGTGEGRSRALDWLRRGKASERHADN